MIFEMSEIIQQIGALRKVFCIAVNFSYFS